jgi:antitoxin component YwqK of YwqJK toxin-antitoxin module
MCRRVWNNQTKPKQEVVGGYTVLYERTTRQLIVQTYTRYQLMIQRTIISLLFFFAVLVAHGQSHTELWPNGKVKATGKMTGKMRTGKWKEYYEDGALKMKGSYKKGDASMYDGSLTGYYAGGQKWYSVVYSSADQTESATEWYRDGKIKATYSATLSSGNRAQLKISASFFSADGSPGGNLNIDTDQKLLKSLLIKDRDTVRSSFRAMNAAHPARAGTEVIKSLFFDVSSTNASLIASINNLFGDMSWQGKTGAINAKGQKTSDTTYYRNNACYSYTHVYRADTLAFSSTVYNGKTYYVFPTSYLKVIRKMPVDLNNPKAANRYGDQIFTDYFSFPKDFPDGTWLMFYPKKGFTGAIIGENQLHLINDDTSRYQFSPCNFVYFQQEYKHHQPHGIYIEYYFQTTPGEYVNWKKPSIADLSLPFQLNIRKRSGIYLDGKREGAFKKYLLDGETYYATEEFKDGLAKGELTIRYHNDSLTRLSQYYSTSIMLETGRLIRNFYPYSSPVANNCISHYYPNKGTFCFYQEAYDIGPVHRVGFNCLGTQRYYADTITNEKYVAARDTAHVACYIRSNYDTATDRYQAYEYRYGKIYRVMIGKGNGYHVTHYSKGKALRPEYFIIDEQGLHQKIN